MITIDNNILQPPITTDNNLVYRQQGVHLLITLIQ